jgi:hypothetical protein
MTGTKRTLRSKKSNYSHTTTDRLLKNHLNSNIFIPKQVDDQLKPEEETNLNYDKNNMPNFIEDREDELMFLHAWLNPATYDKT